MAKVEAKVIVDVRRIAGWARGCTDPVVLNAARQLATELATESDGE